MVDEEHVRRLDVLQQFVVDCETLPSAEEDPGQEENEGVHHRIRRSLAFTEDETLQKGQHERDERSGQDEQDKDEQPQRQIVQQKCRAGSTHAVRDQNGRDDTGGNGEDVFAVGKFGAAAVIADRAERNERHEEQEVQQKDRVAFPHGLGEAFDGAAPFFKGGVADLEPADQGENDGRAEADAEVAEQYGCPKGVGKTGGDLNEFGRDEDDDHLEGFDEDDAERTEKPLVGQELFHAGKVVSRFETDQGDHDILKEENKQQDDDREYRNDGETPSLAALRCAFPFIHEKGLLVGIFPYHIMQSLKMQAEQCCRGLALPRRPEVPGELPAGTGRLLFLYVQFCAIIIFPRRRAP